MKIINPLLKIITTCSYIAILIILSTNTLNSDYFPTLLLCNFFMLTFQTTTIALLAMLLAQAVLITSLLIQEKFVILISAGLYVLSFIVDQNSYKMQGLLISYLTWSFLGTRGSILIIAFSLIYTDIQSALVFVFFEWETDIIGGILLLVVGFVVSKKMVQYFTKVKVEQKQSSEMQSHAVVNAYVTQE